MFIRRDKMNLTEETTHLLERIANESFLVQSQNKMFTFPEAITNDGPMHDPTMQKEWRRLQLSAEFVPIVGVLGGKNAGKTTLVQQFLSSENQPRALVGDDPGQGTNRFVVWAPESWRDDRDKNDWMQNWIATGFGQKPEILPEDPIAAQKCTHALDNQGILLDTPLLGFDKNLDALHMALLDCPDMEVPHGLLSETVEEATAIRVRALRKSSRICSAFFLVQHVLRVEAEVFKELLDNTLNLLEESPPVFLLVSHTVDEAYDWRKDVDDILSLYGADASIQTIFHSPRVRILSGEKVSYFDKENQALDPHALCANLNSPKIKTQRVADGLGLLCISMEKIEAKTNEAAAQRKDVLDSIRVEILRFLKDYYVDDEGNLRNIYTPNSSMALFQAFYNTAPKFVKINLFPAKVVKEFSKFIHDVPTLNKAINKLRGILSRRGRNPEINETKVSSYDFCKYMSVCEQMPKEDEETNKNVWNQSVLYLGQGSYLDLEPDKTQLEDDFRIMWCQMSKLKTIKIGTISVLMFIFTVLVLTVDSITFGAGGAILASATITEVFAALGLGAWLPQLIPHNVNKLFEDQVARPQMSRLFAVLQDGFGIDRAEDGELNGYPENKRMKLTKADEVEKMPPVFVPPSVKPDLRISESGKELMEVTLSLHRKILEESL